MKFKKKFLIHESVTTISDMENSYVKGGAKGN